MNITIYMYKHIYTFIYIYTFVNKYTFIHICVYMYFSLHRLWTSNRFDDESFFYQTAHQFSNLYPCSNLSLVDLLVLRQFLSFLGAIISFCGSFCPSLLTICFHQSRRWIYIFINKRYIHINLCHANVIVAPTSLLQ